MASTFFRTLIPGDGPHKYAQFMAQMSINFERIARGVLERNEKAMKNRDDNTTHGHSRTTSMQQSGNTTTSPSSVIEPGQGSSGLAASVAPSVDIPHIEGFPHGIIPDNLNTESNNTYLPDAPQGIAANPNHAPATTIPNNTHPSMTDAATPIPRIYNTNTTANTNTLFPSIHPTPTPTTTTATTAAAAATSNDLYSFPGFDNIAPPPPGLFHIPLTADWEFPNPFMEGIMAGTNMNTNASATAGGDGGTGAGYPLDLPGGVGTGFGAAGASAPPVDNDMVYEYADQVAQTQRQAQMPMMDTNLAWFGGFF